MIERVVLHVDMDCFFAQIEERENVQFKGKPIVVGADPRKGRGVVSACNYEARKYGIKSAMPISIAKKRCIDGIFLPVNSNLYRKVSQSVFKIVKNISADMEMVSLDEAYLDLTEIVNDFKEAERLGRELKNEILEKEKLVCTIGIGENKMISKLACESVKPNGLRVVEPFDTENFVSDLYIKDIPGIGPKTKDIIETNYGKRDMKVREARALSREQLIFLLGKRGEDFYKKFQGIDDSNLKVKEERKSISKEYTFEKDTRDPEKIISMFSKLSKKVELLTKDKEIRGLSVICRFKDFTTQTKQMSFDSQACEKDFLYKKGVKLLLQILVKNNKEVRLLGVRVVLK